MNGYEIKVGWRIKLYTEYTVNNDKENTSSITLFYFSTFLKEYSKDKGHEGQLNWHQRVTNSIELVLFLVHALSWGDEEKHLFIPDRPPRS